MSMTEWAKREVELAYKREAPNRKDGEWDYGCACYESALKAYLSLMEDEHSGMSFGFTRQILNRLMEGKPLTPIEDVPEVWNDVTWDDKETVYQCRRMGGLFKHVKKDGTVTYSDVNRVVCHNIGDNVCYTSGDATRLIDKLYPITMPYFPPLGRYEITREELLTDRKNGDYDTWAYLTLKTPDGESFTMFRYFKENGNRAVEISVDEYGKRKLLHKQREEAERNEQEGTF